MSTPSLSSAIAVLLSLNFEAIFLVWLGIQASQRLTREFPVYEDQINAAIFVVLLLVGICLWAGTIFLLFKKNSKPEN